MYLICSCFVCEMKADSSCQIRSKHLWTADWSSSEVFRIAILGTDSSLCVLWCFSAFVLQCYCTSVLFCRSATGLQWYCTAVLLCCSDIVLQCYCAPVLKRFIRTCIHTYRATIRGKNGPCPCLLSQSWCDIYRFVKICF